MVGTKKTSKHFRWNIEPPANNTVFNLETFHKLQSFASISYQVYLFFIMVCFYFTGKLKKTV